MKEGAGAFVCGEETALLASLEGRRGMPRLRPPYPAESGLWGRPTSVNNVETYAMVPWIFRNGAEAFARLGHGKEQGDQGLRAGRKVARGGLIEVPMGITVRQIVEEIGGGVAGGRAFKAVQIGGPSGGCVPAELADTPVDFEALSQAGAIMGSGGMVVLDDRDCMVDMARYFLRFTQDQSCGKCTLCRIGTRRMREILDRICTGKGQKGDLENARTTQPHRRGGQHLRPGPHRAQPGALHAALFPREYEAHLAGRCPAGKCKDLIAYRVNDACIGCTLCAQKCPADAIPMTPYARHTIDMQKCTRCDTCRQVCPTKAVYRRINASPHHRPPRNRSAARNDDPRCGRAAGHRDSHALLLAAVRALDLLPGLPGEAAAAAAVSCRPVPRRWPTACRSRARPTRSMPSAAPRWNCS